MDINNMTIGPMSNYRRMTDTEYIRYLEGVVIKELRAEIERLRTEARASLDLALEGEKVRAGLMLKAI